MSEQAHETKRRVVVVVVDENTVYEVFSDTPDVELVVVRVDEDIALTADPADLVEISPPGEDPVYGEVSYYDAAFDPGATEAYFDPRPLEDNEVEAWCADLMGDETEFGDRDFPGGDTEDVVIDDTPRRHRKDVPTTVREL